MKWAPLEDLLVSARAGYWGRDPGAADSDVRIIRNGDVKPTSGVRWKELPTRGLKSAEVLKSQVHVGDLLLTTSGDCGVVAHVDVRPSEVTCASNFIRVLRFDEGRIHPRYAFHYMRTTAFRASLLPYIRGTTLQNLSTRQAFPTVRIPVPPLDEQSRIAHLLDHADRVQRQRGESISLMDQLSQSFFLERFGDPTALGNWSLGTMSDIASKEKHSIVDGPFGSSIKKSDYVESGIPVVRIKNISNSGYLTGDDLLFIRREQFEGLRRSALKPGDVLVSRVGTLGNTCVFPDIGDALLSTTGVCKVTLNLDVMLPEFLHAAIKTSAFQRQIEKSASTSVQKYFNLTALRSWSIIVPPIELQREFVAWLARHQDHRASLISNLGQQRELSESLRARVFAGDL